MCVCVCVHCVTGAIKNELHKTCLMVFLFAFNFRVAQFEHKYQITTSCLKTHRAVKISLEQQKPIQIARYTHEMNTSATQHAYSYTSNIETVSNCAALHLSQKLGKKKKLKRKIHAHHRIDSITWNLYATSATCTKIEIDRKIGDLKHWRIR